MVCYHCKGNLRVPDEGIWTKTCPMCQGKADAFATICYEPDIVKTEFEGWTHTWCKCGKEIEMPDLCSMGSWKGCIECFGKRGGFDCLEKMGGKER